MYELSISPLYPYYHCKRCDLAVIQTEIMQIISEHFPNAPPAPELIAVCSSVFLYEVLAVI